VVDTTTLAGRFIFAATGLSAGASANAPAKLS
jgi:hypothetical protein